MPGLCKVDETPKGWYVQYIDRDPDTIRRQEELDKKKKHDLDDEERIAKFVEEQVRRGLGGKEPEVSATFRPGGRTSAGHFAPASKLTSNNLFASHRLCSFDIEKVASIKVCLLSSLGRTSFYGAQTRERRRKRFVLLL